MMYESPFRSVCKVHTYHSLTGFEPLDFRKSKERSPLEDGGACCCSPGGPGRDPAGPGGGMPPGPPGGCGQLLLNIPLLYIMLGPPTCATLPSIKEVVAVSCSPPTSPQSLGGANWQRGAASSHLTCPSTRTRILSTEFEKSQNQTPSILM